MKTYVKDYPRPQLVRDSFINLNGAWQFAFDDENRGEAEGWFRSFPQGKTINVPFTYETKMSGIQDETVHSAVWYQREIQPGDCKGKRVVIHFEGSDFLTKVWVNGTLVGSHKGGYSRFSFDITDQINLNGANTVTVKAEDTLRDDQPRGKQRWMHQNFGCWYVQTTGIWKTVWMELTNPSYINTVKITPDLDNLLVKLEFDIESARYSKDLLLEATIAFDGEFINSLIVPVLGRKVTMTVPLQNEVVDEWKIRPWSPKRPDLYDANFRLIETGSALDTVDSYFGLRKISISGDRVLLNNEPIYQRLILDQGYWKDSHLTPPSEEALIEDIDKITALGYNGLRKHQKTEDERFLYWCDVKGVLVWSEMAAAYTYNDDAVEEFAHEWTEIVRQNYNHPCIITWTPINESWGVRDIRHNKQQQHFSEMVYYLTKSIDAERPVIVNDGWEHTISDIITLHDYEELGDVLLERYADKEQILNPNFAFSKSRHPFAQGYSYHGQPIIISEFGGIAFNNDDSGWGYGNKVTDKEAFIRRFDSITTAIKKLPYVCGFCYTQVTDVQQEINGLMDIDRNFKIDSEIIREINER